MIVLFMQAVAALLLVLGSALVIQAVYAADRRGEPSPRSGATPRQDEEPPYPKAA